MDQPDNVWHNKLQLYRLDKFGFDLKKINKSFIRYFASSHLCEKINKNFLCGCLSNPIEDLILKYMRSEIRPSTDASSISNQEEFDGPSIN